MKTDEQRGIGNNSNLEEMEQRIIAKTTDELYDDLEDIMVDRETFDNTLEELTAARFLVRMAINDETCYHAAEGLSWIQVREIDNPGKQAILSYFIENPDTFFLIVTTQKGKARISAKQIASWTGHENRRCVSIMIVDNDQGLSDQTVAGLQALGMPVTLYHLSGSASTAITVEGIKHAIDSYAAFGGRAPLIVALCNPKQIEKVRQVLAHVRIRYETTPMLRYGIIFDEADKVYPQCRDKLLEYTSDNAPAKHCVGYVSATDGDLVISDRFPECANASVLYGDIDPSDDPHYRAMHTPGVNVKTVEGRATDRNNAMALATIDKNLNYFRTQIRLKSGQVGFRKTIVNSNASKNDMKKFATEMNQRECHAITFNQTGLTVYRAGNEGAKPVVRVRRLNLNKALLYAVKAFNLEDRPLFVIGRRKVDRGLGFHYAPRSHRDDFVPKPEEVEYIKGMKIVISGREGLVWTDMILGHIQDKDSAAQKAGRLAGIVEQCPEYPVDGLTWWTTEATKNLVIRHNQIVDSVNTQAANGGLRTALQAITRAENDVPAVPIVGNDFVNHLEPFGSMTDLIARLRILFNDPTKTHRTPRRDTETGKYKCSLSGPGDISGVQTADDIRASFGGDIGSARWGGDNAVSRAAVNEKVKRVYVGYEGEVPVFFLRWGFKTR